MNTFKMKKILIIAALCLTALVTKAQFYGFETQPVCWDSSGVRIQLYSVQFYVIGNTAGTFIGYMDKTGANRTVDVVAADLTDGFCLQLNTIDSLSTITVTTAPDTALEITCVLLTREMTNTVDASILYPRHQLEKHTYSVGTEIVDVKYFIPQTGDLVTSPVIGISVMGCNDFDIGDFVNMLYEGDTVAISAGDTLEIDPVTGNFRTISIVCDPDNMDVVKLIVDYLPVEIDGAPVSVAGNKFSYLTTYSNIYQQVWEYQWIDKFRLVAIGADCRCNYVVTNERNKFN